ncbi:MAG: DUF1294 domain-containing protein [Bacilli bacterium]|nr:DUF1294 domain-containing protein [Bacilli bacterium]
MIIINIYLIVLNIITFLIMGIDKYLAIKKKYRISEFHLLTLTLFGGSVGSLLGMIIFRHKTKKMKFLIIIPLSIIIHILIYLQI